MTSMSERSTIFPVTALLRHRLAWPLITLLLLLGICGMVLLLYLVKSALGIDIFKHFSFGVWDLFKKSVLM